MRMNIFLTIMLVFSQAFAGLPPTTLNGKTTFKFQVPYNQATTTAGVTTLVQTDNEDFLVNGDFEASGITSSVVPGWTLGSGVTAAAEASEIKSGRQAVLLTLASTNGLVLSQDVTPGVKVKGDKLPRRIAIKTSLTTVQICAREAGATVGQCSTAFSNNEWVTYSVDASGPASGSVGLSVITTGSTTGTLYVDYGKLGRTQNPTILDSTPYQAGVLVAGGISRQSTVNLLTGSCTIADTSEYTCPLNTSLFKVTPFCTVEPFTNTANASAYFTDLSTSSVKVRTYAGSTKTAVAFWLACEKTGTDVASSSVQSVNAPPAPTVQRFTSGSGTYNRPNGVKYIRVRMVGGGGGGAGSGTASASSNGTSGGNTTFGTSLLTANGGVGASWGGSQPNGGTATISAPAYGSAWSGAAGNPTTQYLSSGSNVIMSGAAGASSQFGGAGPGGTPGVNAGLNAAQNTGSGGGGGATQVALSYPGPGGAAGGFIDAYIQTPAATYPYAVGTAGTGGAAGTSGAAGGNGGSGYIEVTEYYNTGDVVELTKRSTFKGVNTAGTTIAVGSDTAIPFTQTELTNGTWNGTTWTATEAGVYAAHCKFLPSAARAYYITIKRNNTSPEYVYNGSASVSSTAQTSGTYYMAVGDTLGCYGQVETSTVTLNGGTGYNVFSIYKVAN